MESCVAKLLGQSTQAALKIYHEVRESIADGKVDMMLPEVIVVGKQSAGKSSLLTQLLKGAVEFPAAAGMCTPCPMRVKSVYTKHERKCELWIDFKWDSNSLELPENASNQGSKRSFTADNWSEIPQAIKELQSEALNAPNCKQKVEVTMNQVVVKVEGCEFPNIMLTDFPGLIADGSSREAIESMALEAMRRSRAIIIACVAADDDVENQSVLKMVREVDPDGERTIGVLTKCDRVQEGAEDRVMSVLANEHPKCHFSRGWYAVRCLPPKERSEAFDSHKADQGESDFFQTDPIGKKMKMKMDRFCGSEKLLEAVSSTIAAFVEKQVSGLRELVERELDTAKSECHKLGPTTSKENVKDNILDLIAGLDKNTFAMVNSLGEQPMEFWQELMRVSGDMKSNIENTYQSREQGQNILDIANVNDILEKSRGNRLLQNRDVDYASKVIMKQGMKDWSGLCTAYLHRVRKIVAEHFEHVLKNHLKEYVDAKLDLPEKMRISMDHLINQLHDEVEAEAVGFVKQLREQPETVNFEEVRDKTRVKVEAFARSKFPLGQSAGFTAVSILAVSVLKLWSMFMGTGTKNGAQNKFGLVTGKAQKRGRFGIGHCLPIIVKYFGKFLVVFVAAQMTHRNEWIRKLFVMLVQILAPELYSCYEAMAQAEALCQQNGTQVSDYMFKLSRKMLNALATRLNGTLRKDLNVVKAPSEDLVKMMVSPQQASRRENSEMRMQKLTKLQERIAAFETLSSCNASEGPEAYWEVES